ncbi:MAG: hypothetical protein H0T65_06705 [Deltaproteobacteria bacterium]|nr:hypothetical protein [Deltaproteobacteria bacterium]
MAKKQTRRSISVSRTTYERLKAFCEANNISMSQLVETRVNDFLGEGTTTITPRPETYRPPSVGSHYPQPIRPLPTTPTTSSISPSSPSSPTTHSPPPIKSSMEAAPHRPSQPIVPMTSAAARYAVEPPPPIIKPKQETAAPKPAEKRADQIFTF